MRSRTGTVERARSRYQTLSQHFHTSCRVSGDDCNRPIAGLTQCSDNNKLREQFDRLGYVVPKQTWTLKSPAPANAPPPRLPHTTAKTAVITQNAQPAQKTLQPLSAQSIMMIENAPPALPQAQPHSSKPQQLPFRQGSSSSHTIPGPAKSLQNLHTVHNVVDAISRKRAANDGGQDSERAAKSPRLDKPSSRGMMPPPPLPFRRPTGLSEIPANKANSQFKQPAPAFVRPDQRSSANEAHRHVVSESAQLEAVDRLQAHSPAGHNLNIFQFQESSPTRRTLTQTNPTGGERSHEPILDPRRGPQEHLQEQEQYQTVWQDGERDVNEADWRQNAAHQNFGPKQAIMQYSDSPQQHQFSTFVHSDPVSVMYSPHPAYRQHLSDPSRAPTRSQVKHAIPRQSVDDITSPFFVGGKKAPTRNGRLTLPSHAKMGGSSQATKSMNSLSFIGEPHNSITHQRLRTAATQHALQSRAAMPAPIRQPGNGFVQRRPAQNMNMSVQRGPSRSLVNTPFRTPIIQKSSEPLYRGYPQQQAPQNYFARGVATPQQAPRRHMAGTPVLMPSRAGTTASRAMGHDARFDGFAYSGGHEGQYDSRGFIR